MNCLSGKRSNSEDDGGEDSKIDENLEICKLEKGDFEDQEGIKLDVELIKVGCIRALLERCFTVFLCAHDPFILHLLLTVRTEKF
jgi:hypothetical protein